MTIDDIIIELYNTNFVFKYTAEMLTNRDVIELDDAVMEVWVCVIEWLRKNQDKALKMYEKGGINKIRQVVAGIITRQCRSQSSSLYYKYVKKSTKNLVIKRQTDKRVQWDEENGWSD